MSPRIWIGVTLLLVQAAVANSQPKNLEALYRAGVEAVLCQNSAQPVSTKEPCLSKSNSSSSTRTGYAAAANI